MEYSTIYVRRIRQLCKERGFAINMLAKRAGINQSTIDNIVRGLTYEAFFPLVSVACIYLFIILILSAFVSKLEKNLKKNER